MNLVLDDLWCRFLQPELSKNQLETYYDRSNFVEISQDLSWQASNECT